MSEDDFLHMLAGLAVRRIPGATMVEQAGNDGYLERIWTLEMTDEFLRHLAVDQRVAVERDQAMRLWRLVVREPVWGTVEAGFVETA